MNPLMQRRVLVQKFIAGMSMLRIADGAWATPAILPVTDSLPNALATALQSKQPLVVMVSLHGCSFCNTDTNCCDLFGIDFIERPHT